MRAERYLGKKNSTLSRSKMLRAYLTHSVTKEERRNREANYSKNQVSLEFSMIWLYVDPNIAVRIFTREMETKIEYDMKRKTITPWRVSLPVNSSVVLSPNSHLYVPNIDTEVSAVIMSIA